MCWERYCGDTQGMSPREEPTGTFPVQKATSMWSLGTCADSEKKKVLRKRDRRLEME